MIVVFRVASLLLLVSAVAAPLHANAPDPAADAEALISSAETLTKRLDATGAKGTPPTLSNADAVLVRTAFNADVLRAMPLDLDKVSRACVGIGNALIAYVAVADRSGKGARNPVAVSEAKLAQLQNELTAGSIAANLCVQKGFRAVSAFVATLTPAQRANLREPMGQMRDGAAMTISSSIGTAAMPSISLENRAKILAAVFEDLRFTAASFTPADKRKLSDQVITAARDLPPSLVERSRDIISVLQASDCNLLCQAAN